MTGHGQAKCSRRLQLQQETSDGQWMHYESGTAAHTVNQWRHTWWHRGYSRNDVITVGVAINTVGLSEINSKRKQTERQTDRYINTVTLASWRSRCQSVSFEVMLSRLSAGVSSLLSSADINLLWISPRRQIRRSITYASTHIFQSFQTTVVRAWRPSLIWTDTRSFRPLLITSKEAKTEEISSKHKILTGEENIKSSLIFQKVSIIHVRGHNLKLYKKRSRLDTRKYFSPKEQESLADANGSARQR